MGIDFERASRLPRLWLQPLVCLAITSLITGIVFRATPVSLVSTWYGSRSYSYGFVVVPVCALLVWRRRTQLSGIQPAISYIGIILVALFAVIWLLGNVGDVQIIQQVAFIGMLESCLLTFLGVKVVRTLAFPLAFLFFAVPAGEGLVAPLQRITAAFAVNAVRLSGVPAVQEGMLLSTPSGNWRIAEACSGIRYLTSSLVIGVLVAGIAVRHWKRRILFVLLSVAVPVIANAVRAYLIIMLAYISNNHIASGIDHIVYGWVFFTAITAGLVALGLAWREPEIMHPGALECANNSSQVTTKGGHAYWVATVVLLIVAPVSSIADLLWSRSSVESQQVSFLAPDGWVEAEPSDHGWDPDLSKGDSRHFARDFVRGSQEVSLYIATYSSKRGGVELINSFNATGLSGGWEVINTAYCKVEIGGIPATVTEYVVASGGQVRVVWTWYVSGGQRLLNGAYQVKVSQARNRLLGHPQDVSIYALSTRMQGGYSAATTVLQEFAKAMRLPEHDGSLPNVQEFGND